MKTYITTLLAMLAIAYACLMVGMNREAERIELQKKAWQDQGYNIK